MMIVLGVLTRDHENTTSLITNNVNPQPIRLNFQQKSPIIVHGLVLHCIYHPVLKMISEFYRDIMPGLLWGIGDFEGLEDFSPSHFGNFSVIRVR